MMIVLRFFKRFAGRSERSVIFAAVTSVGISSLALCNCDYEGYTGFVLQFWILLE
jgi:hypothetical protein